MSVQKGNHIEPGLTTDKTSTAHDCNFVCVRCKKVLVDSRKLYSIRKDGDREGHAVSIWVAEAYPSIAQIPDGTKGQVCNFGGETITTDKKIKDWDAENGGSMELYHECEKRSEGPGPTLVGHIFFDDVETPRSREGLSEEVWKGYGKWTAWRPKLNLVDGEVNQNLENHLMVLVKDEQHVERHVFKKLPTECKALAAHFGHPDKGAEFNHLRNLLRSTKEGQFLQIVASYALRKQRWEFSVLESAYDEYFRDYLARNGSAMELFTDVRSYFVTRYLLAIQNSLEKTDAAKKLALCEKVLEGTYPAPTKLPSDVAREMLIRYEERHTREVIEARKMSNPREKYDMLNRFVHNWIGKVRKIFNRSNSKEDVNVLNKYHELELKADKLGRNDQARKHFKERLHPCTLRTRWHFATKTPKPKWLDFPVFKCEAILKDLETFSKLETFPDDAQSNMELRELLSTLFAPLIKPGNKTEDTRIRILLSQYRESLFKLAARASGDTAFHISTELAHHELYPEEDIEFHPKMEGLMKAFLDSEKEDISITSAASLFGYVATLKKSWVEKKTKISKLWDKCKLAYHAPTSSSMEGYWKIDIAHPNKGYADDLKKKIGSLDAFAIYGMYLELVKQHDGTNSFEGLEIVVGKGNKNLHHDSGEEKSKTQELVDRFMPREFLESKNVNAGSLLVTRAHLDEFFGRDDEELWENIFRMETSIE